MCGRYYIGDYVSEKLEDITSGRGISQIKTGDVYPSQTNQRRVYIEIIGYASAYPAYHAVFP